MSINGRLNKKTTISWIIWIYYLFLWFKNAESKTIVIMTKNRTNSSNSNQDISYLLLSLVCATLLQNVDVSNRCRAWPLNKRSTSYSLFCSNGEMKRKPYLILHKTKNYDRLIKDNTNRILNSKTKMMTPYKWNI